MRLSELTYIKSDDIDWDNYIITIWGKGNKQRRAPFTQRTAKLLTQVVSQNGSGANIWHIEPHGIQLTCPPKNGASCCVRLAIKKEGAINGQEGVQTGAYHQQAASF